MLSALASDRKNRGYCATFLPRSILARLLVFTYLAMKNFICLKFGSVPIWTLPFFIPILRRSRGGFLCAFGFFYAAQLVLYRKAHFRVKLIRKEGRSWAASKRVTRLFKIEPGILFIQYTTISTHHSCMYEWWVFHI